MQQMTNNITKTLPDMETNYQAGSTKVEFQSSSTLGAVSILITVKSGRVVYDDHHANRWSFS